MNTPSDFMLEAKEVGSAMLVTGALNPYTLAHEAVTRQAMEHAMSNGHTHFYHGIGASEMKPDAPLTHEQKTKIVKGSHKNLVKKLGSKLKTEVIPKISSISPFHQIAYLISKGHKRITVAVGSDQVESGGLRTQIEKHMKQHGGFLGIDKKPHKVEIEFKQIGEPRHEGEIERSEILRQIKNGDIKSVKAGRLRAAVAAGDTELAYSMMPESITNKKAYFDLIDKQQRKVAKVKTTKKKKITECFSPDVLNEFSKFLSEGPIVQSIIGQRETEAKNKIKQASAAASKKPRGTRTQYRQMFVKNARDAIKYKYMRRLMAAKEAEISSGLDKKTIIGQPSKHPIREELMNNPRESFVANIIEFLNEAKRGKVDSPSKVRKKVRTEARAANRGATGHKKDKIRKQEDRREAKKSQKYAIVVSRDKKIKIVTKQDIGSSKVLVSPEEFNKAKAKDYLKKSEFEITDSSKKLFPEFSREKPKTKTKEKKTDKKETKGKKKKKSTVTDKPPREVLPQLPEAPKGGRERTTPKSQYPDFNHTSLELEAAIPVMLNQLMGAKVDPTLAKKIGEKIKTSKTLGPSAQRAAQAIVDLFGEVVSVHMGAAKTTITPLWKGAGGADTTPKTDILLVPKKVFDKAKGDMSKMDMSQAIRCSMKVGDARVINAESGEAAATVEAALQMAGNIASQNKKVKSIIKEIKEAMLKFAKSAETGQFTVDDIRDIIASKEEPDDPNFKKYAKLIKEQDKLKDFVAEKFREVFDISEEFRTALLRESFTGVSKFGEDSPACATHVLAMTKDGSNLAIEEISDEFLEKILPDLKIRGAFKGRSWDVKNEKGKKIKFRGFSTLFNIDYKRRLHEQQEEQELQQNVETIQPTDNFNFPNATQIVKDELNQIGDNFGLLMKYSELEPSMITSNTLDLTDYANVPARAYNTITIDNSKVITVPVHDFERYEQQQQQEVELMNEDMYHQINDFLVENENNSEGLDLVFTSGLLSPETISNSVNGFILANILNEMWENSLLNPEQFKLFMNEARNYKKEYREYHGKAEQRANRSKRVLARRKMIKKGKVRKGDNKDVHHRDGNPQNNEDGNLGVLPKSKNRAMHEEHGAGEIGTPELLQKFVDETPGAVNPVQAVIKGVVKNGVKRK